MCFVALRKRIGAFYALRLMQKYQVRLTRIGCIITKCSLVYAKLSALTNTCSINLLVKACISQIMTGDFLIQFIAKCSSDIEVE